MAEPVIGMDAPHDHDYHAVEQWIAANCNQATDLPATGAFELPVIEPALKLDSNFGLWYSQVVQILKWHSLGRLVDPGPSVITPTLHYGCSSPNKEFVSVLKQRLHSAINLEANILPYHALIAMLRQLQTVPTLDAFAMSEIRKLEARTNPVADTTMADFYDACTAILNYVKENELDPEVATPSAHSKAVDFLRKRNAHKLAY
ncbi:unnamed protein product [Penicillium discolor]